MYDAAFISFINMEQGETSIHIARMGLTVALACVPGLPGDNTVFKFKLFSMRVALYIRTAYLPAHPCLSIYVSLDKFSDQAWLIRVLCFKQVIVGVVATIY